MPATQPDKILAQTMMLLFQTAAKDGKITKEELKFISEMDITLNYYKDALQKAYADGIITKEECDHLDKIKDIIITEGYEVAEEYKGVSKDILNLLVTIICSLKVPKPTQ